jgi:hypothetical protein
VDEDNNIVTGFAPNGKDRWSASGQIGGAYGIARAEVYVGAMNHDAQLGAWHRFKIVVPAVGVHEVWWDDTLVYRVVEKTPPAAWWGRPMHAGLRLDFYDYSLRNLLTASGVPDMFHVINPIRNSDTRIYPKVPVGPGEMTWDVSDQVPTNAVAVAMNVVAVEATVDGFVTVWPGGSRPDTSVVNFQGDKKAYNGSMIVGIRDRSFGIYTSQPAHLIVDITGYWTH